ncbi:hypothetical protein PACTADRAFT_84362 [Pachysolen tannophilus NRRL Y-2460]|uniref:Phospholipid-transporting ATPase n=1 Tax=Pachysolen tannophilus NRRL Y-2460 TaxID=669874 RepID=A0A1E4TZF1_PACTA|nr:hypothetical protein PACTADRAFT_84362 [Pachysolen tannophilus NRRL Y-2460]
MSKRPLNANSNTLFDIDLLNSDNEEDEFGSNKIEGKTSKSHHFQDQSNNSAYLNPFEDSFLDSDLVDGGNNKVDGSSIPLNDLNPFGDKYEYNSNNGGSGGAAATAYDGGYSANGAISNSGINRPIINDEDDDILAPPDPELSEDIKNNFDIRKIFSRLFHKNHSSITNDSSKPRIIHINDQISNNAFKYIDNHISTTKYNLATFLPKFLFEQFSKYANLFFLFTSIIQQVPNVTPTNRYTTIGTLAVVLLVSALKEILEDFKRLTADNELNYNSKVEVLRNGDFHLTKWINVKVGDIVRVKIEEPIPADLIILSTSEPEGLCYIETSNLDGETNLKIKQARSETSKIIEPFQLKNELHGKILSEQPNSSLYGYEGTLILNGNEIPLNPEQMVLRGATLRNTGFINGIVIFTGHETKLMRNATAAPIKKTAVERIINLQILFLFGILVILSFISSLGNVLKITFDQKHLSYLYLEGKNKFALFFQDLLTYWILFSNLVPISLFVTVEIIKVYQGFMISSDLDLYCEETDTPTTVRTSSIIEELGQIQYIFSDKTGTLTRNVMEFKTCTIGGKCYIEKIPEDEKFTVGTDGIETGYHSFEDLFDTLDNDSEEQGPIIDEFLTLLAACHTVIPEVKPNGTIKYQAASPDEGALVDGARVLGYKFKSRTPSTITIELRNGQSLSYELLNICEFNSTRKRMSALFRCPDGSIRLYTKGADTVILERLHDDNPFVDATLAHLETFAAEGLRTLCIATRIVPEEEYQEWLKRYTKASVTLINRAEEVDKVAELIEKDLFLLGATAIEDKLQEDVPDTIHTLQDAGIKIWILTGDKQETAINIGMSCKLLSEDMNLLIINEDTKEETRDNLLSKLDALHSTQLTDEEINSLALIIDGKSLGFALESDLEDYLLQIGMLCKSVICCRVSPLQKALVVKLVKRKTSSLLLAVGDGANDVSMIQAAHVGVGISGKEGMQAARSADFAIGQFKFLKKLLLVHGSWSYQRISQAILYSFYKNIALYMTQFWYVFANCFSGESIIESWTLTFYNVFFTVAPPFVLGVFDQFISARFLERYPQLYRLGQQSVFFNTNIFWTWIINGFYHSGILFVGSMFVYRYGNVLPNGLIADHWTWGTAVFTSCTLTALGKAALVSNLWTKFTLIAIPGSFLFWLIFFPVYASVAPNVNVSPEYRGVLPHVFGSLTFWAMTFILPLLCLVRDFAWKYYKRMYSPESYHFVQEVQKYNINDHNPRLISFHKKIRRMRQIKRLKKFKGYAFEDGGGERLVRLYDTTI